MKDKRDDAYFDGEDRSMLASNLAASLNIPPDITITAVSVPAKTMTPPPLPPAKNHQILSMTPNSSNLNGPVNLMVNTPINFNIGNLNTNTINSSGSSANRNSPMNFSLSSPNNQMHLASNNQTSVINLSGSNQNSVPSSGNQTNQSNQLAEQQNLLPAAPGHSKYSQLLDVIEEIGKDIRPTYSGSKSSAERLKRSIGLARILIRQCIMETEPGMKS